MSVTVTIDDIRTGVRNLGLSGSSVCVHSSLRSFGRVESGADSVIDGVLAEGCTLLVPTFSGTIYGVRPPPDDRPPRNGCDYTTVDTWPHNPDRIFTVDSTDVIESMGIVPRTLVRREERTRGYHPGSSFSAIGPRGADLTDPQGPLDPFAPIEALASMDGAVVLVGVGLDRMTLLHQAEKRAGRTLLRRWAIGLDGRVMRVEGGGCSSGFEKLAEGLRSLERRTTVGESLWRVYPAEQTLRAAAEEIARDPSITHCDQECDRCDDALAGGPILD